MNDEFDDFAEEQSAELEKSKTQIKQELKDITKLGRQLSELSLVKLNQLPLNEDIIEAFEKLTAIKGNEGKKRHFKYIGKLLRNIDIVPVQQAYIRHQKGQPLTLTSPSSLPTPEPSAGATWAERMLDDPQAGEEFLMEHPLLDRQQLRQHVRNARKSEKNKLKFVQFVEQLLN